MEVRDLAVHFRARRAVAARAVDGVSLEWRRGEILGVVGESGCGKSTLARAMLGLAPARRPATVALDGDAVNGKSEPARAAPARADDLPGPLPDAEPAPAGGARSSPSRCASRAWLAASTTGACGARMEDVGLDPERFLDRYPHQLSGGQRQRVAIAAALVLEPDGLICDEPVSMLDVSVRAQILAVLIELRSRRDLALLFITHDLSLAWSLCDRIAVMYLGRIVEQGTAVDVIERPQHPYTQALVAAVPVPVGGRGRSREPLTGELPDATDVPSGLPLPPALPAPLRAVRQRRSVSCSPRPATGSWPPACCTTRRTAPDAAGVTLAGPVGRLEPGARATRSPTCPGCGSATPRRRAASAPGVTVVAPPSLPAPRGRRAVINGVGELTAKLEIDERGVIETPVYLCGSHAVGTVFQAAVLASGRGPDDVVLPVVGECDDGDMADSRTVAIGDVDGALAALGSEVAEGSVGAGTGMICFGFPGGIGTASRVVGDHHVGVLLLCNFGDREYLDVPGLDFDPPADRPEPHGSCIAVCATDAPLSAQQLRRLALRPLLGLARTGSYGAEGSGEIGLAFTTAAARTCRPTRLDPYFAAAYEAAHEAVYNCLVAARPAERLDGSDAGGLPGRRPAGALGRRARLRLLALGLRRRAQLLEAHDLAGRAPVALGHLVDQHPHAHAVALGQAGGVADQLRELLHEAGLAAVAESARGHGGVHHELAQLGLAVGGVDGLGRQLVHMGPRDRAEELRVGRALPAQHRGGQLAWQLALGVIRQGIRRRR